MLLKLLANFNTPEEIFAARLDELVEVTGVSVGMAQKILKAKSNYRETLGELKKEAEKLSQLGGKILAVSDDEYPERLRNIYSPPVLLYYIGDVSLLNSNSIAIVGTRKPSRYGIKQAEYFSEQLTENGLVIVSGLARGIDSAAHRACLKSGGKTVAVTGSGLNWIYPPENKSLFLEIAEKGLILSEYKLGTKPDGKNFPQRNRIIAGLTLGTLVIETKTSGGALNTASIALNEGREVFAVPGNLGATTSEGTNLLIQRGEAKITLKVSDILEELNIAAPKEKEKKVKQVDISQLNLFEQKIYESLTDEPLHIDSISAKSGLSVVDCSIHLLSLEFKGIVEQLPGKYFVKT